MPKLSEEQKKEALTHVLVEVLDLPIDGPVAKAFKKAGIDEPMSIVNLTERQVSLLSYDETDEHGTTTACPINTFVHAPLILSFKRWIKYLQDNKQPVKNDWKQLEFDDFHEFMPSTINHDDLPLTPAQQMDKDANDNANAAIRSPAKKVDEVQSFKKGIHRDPAMFIALNRDSDFRKWNKTTII